MPRSQLQSSSSLRSQSLLSDAVRTLFDVHRVEAVSTEAPLTYVLGAKGDAWTVDDVLPASILLGWRAPPSSWALVVVASGRAWGLGPDGAPSRPDAASSQPDGALSKSDGALSKSDGALSKSDAAPSQPDAAPSKPDGALSKSDGALSKSDAALSGPGANRWGPNAIGRAPEFGSCPDSGRGPALPVGLAVGVARGGETAGRLAGAGAITDPAPDGGRLLDTLRRNLGLATPAPPEATGRFLAVAWMAALWSATSIRPASAGRASGAPAWDPGLGWPAALRLHPAARLLSARGEHLRTAELEGVVEIAQSTWTWDVLRRAESANASIVALGPPGTAGWMDAGMYARWVLADLPPTASVWRLVRPFLTPVARRRLQAWFRRDGVDLDDGR